MPLWKVAAVAATYFVTGKLGLLLAIPPGVATVLWPPSGIALAAVMLWGYRVWPGVWVGSLLVNIGTVFDPTGFWSVLGSLGVTGAIATGSTLQALLGAFVVQRVLGSTHPFGKAKHVAIFIGLMMASCLVAATLGATSLAAGGNIAWSVFPTTWWTWWTGDLIGILPLAPIHVCKRRRPGQATAVARRSPGAMGRLCPGRFHESSGLRHPPRTCGGSMATKDNSTR